MLKAFNEYPEANRLRVSQGLGLETLSEYEKELRLRDSTAIAIALQLKRITIEDFRLLHGIVLNESAPHEGIRKSLLRKAP